MKLSLPLRLLLVLLMYGLNAAQATTGPPTTGRSLAEALNPDGTLRRGAAGSFDARAFRMGTAPDGRPVFRPTSTAGAGDERWRDGFNLPNGGADGTVLAVVQSGTDTYIGGVFTAVGNVLANHVAKWNGTTWSALGTGAANGVSDNVNALAVASNGDVYVGGSFREAGGVPANYVAMWNGTSWSSLGTGTANGVSAFVYALAVAGNGNVYAGGSFGQAGGIVANHVAMWNGTAWSALGMGVQDGQYGGYEYALAVAGNGDVYAGGMFNQAGGLSVGNVARWNGTAWSALGTAVVNGVSGGYVYALAVAGNGDVYVGGDFAYTSGMPYFYVAKWNGTTWSGLGTGAPGSVKALALASNGDLYVGCNSLNYGRNNYVARWNGTTWNALGSGNDTNYQVLALALASNGDVYVGGDFARAGGVAASNFAKWNGTAWSSPGAGLGNGTNYDIYALAVAGNGDVYVGGNFTQVGETAAIGIAKWNGTAWSRLGVNGGLNNMVYAVAVAGNGDVYAGGYFTQADGILVSKVAKWNGTTWSSLGTGSGNGVNGPSVGGVNNTFVYALAVAGNGDVYVGGNFNQAGGVAANGVAKWNGTAWSSLGAGLADGLNGSAYTLAVAGNGDVYVGGYFTQAGGVAANGVARWNGTAWSSLGAGLASSNSGASAVRGLAVASNGDVYVTGVFDQAGGVMANNVARWNGTTWSSLGTGAANGLNNNGYTLALASNGDVYIGGKFTQAGGAMANRIAKWDGTSWSSLGTGLNAGANALGFTTTSKVNVGGSFTATGDGSKVMAHFAIYDPAAPLATAATKATPAAQFFPNPAHGTATLRLPAGALRLPLTLTDALGRQVRQYPAPTGPEAVLDLRGLPTGNYLVRCGQLAQRLVVE